jgi:hypothetical protein
MTLISSQKKYGRVLSRLFFLLALLANVAGCGNRSDQHPQEDTTKLSVNEFNNDVLASKKLSSPPSICSHPGAEEQSECFASRPFHCTYSGYSEGLNCFGANPEYCGYDGYADSPACYASQRSYCQHSGKSEKAACVGSNPEYCSSGTYADSSACLGSNPTYCAQGEYKESLACLNLPKKEALKKFCEKNKDRLNWCGSLPKTI